MIAIEDILSNGNPNYKLDTYTYEEVLDISKRYAKQLLEDYTNRIVENVRLDRPGRYGRTTSKTYYGEDGEVFIDEKSITNQLPLMLEELGI